MLIRRYLFSLAATFAALAASACGGDPAQPPEPPGSSTPASITVQSGNNQQAASQTAVATAPSVQVKDADGKAVAGATVQFTVAAGGGTIAGASPATDASGIARITSWTLGNAGAQRLSAKVGTLGAVFFDAAITPGTEITTATVPTTGGTVEITTPGHPYLGFKLTVPAGTYTGNVEFEMRVMPNAPLPAMPSGYRVSGPALEISTTQMRGAKLMTLDIPVTRAANEDVLIALYDPTRRIIEVMPTVGRTPTSVRVMTGHLRADLLVGRPRPSATIRTGEAPAAQVSHHGADPTAYMLQIALSLPLQPVAPVLNPAVDGWPVIDHGSTYFPMGHGPAIPGLVNLGAALSAGLNQKVIPLPRPGFYADAAPLAAVVDARRQLSGLASTIDQMKVAMAGLSKAVRDEMVHHNVVGGMGITGSSSVVALMPAPGLEPVFVNTVSGTETTLTTISAQAIVNQLVKALTGSGYDAVLVVPSADEPPVTVDGVIPAPSFVFPELVGLSTMFTTLNAPLGSAEREAGNRAMSAFLGFPTGGMDIMPFLGSPWHSTSSGTPIAIRNGDAFLRLANFGSTPELLVNSLIGLAEVARVDQGGLGFFTTSGLPDFAAAPELGQVKYLITPTGTMVGGIKQSGSFTMTLVKATFKVSPSEVELPANRKVDLVAEVPFPPTGGFRLKWDWGDGTTPTETVGVLTATHTYAQSGDYVVKVTLQENTAGREELGVVVVPVTGVPAPFWKVTAWVDVDDLVDAPGVDPGQGGPLFDLLWGPEALPGSALIAITGNQLTMRVKRTGTWTECCPPPFGTDDYVGDWPTWSQSTTDLSSGTVTGVWTDGPSFFNFNATRNGKTMTGTMTLIISDPDDETGEIEISTFRFTFTAERMK